jgi:DNA-binding XRE family transcriptional regulator
VSTPEKLERLGQRVEQERVSRGWGKEQAAREAGISSITWKRIEDGQPVQDMKRRAVEITLGWEYGSMDRVMEGREPVVMVGPLQRAEPPGAAFSRDREANRPLWEAVQGVYKFAELAREAGGAPEFIEDLYTAAIALLGSVSRRNEILARSDAPADVTELAVRRDAATAPHQDDIIDRAAYDPGYPMQADIDEQHKNDTP